LSSNGEETERKLSHAEVMVIYATLFKTCPEVNARILSRKVDVESHKVTDLEEVNYGTTERGTKKFQLSIR
jgi:hypothetical protein